MKRLLILFTLIATALSSYAQGVGGGNGNGKKSGRVWINLFPVAIINIAGTSGTSISLSMGAPDEAGMPLDLSQATDSTLWINYTAITGWFSRPKVDVFAKITSGSVPPGMTLKVKALNDAGQGLGNVGTPNGEITLTGSDQKLIKNIRTCYTGYGPNKGHQLVYRLDYIPSNYASIDFDNSTTVTVEYTITD